MDRVLVVSMLVHGWEKTIHGECEGVSSRCRQRRIHLLLNRHQPEMCHSTLEAGLLLLRLERRASGSLARRGPHTATKKKERSAAQLSVVRFFKTVEHDHIGDEDTSKCSLGSE